jgi:hypothetical protein
LYPYDIHCPKPSCVVDMMCRLSYDSEYQQYTLCVSLIVSPVDIYDTYLAILLMQCGGYHMTHNISNILYSYLWMVEKIGDYCSCINFSSIFSSIADTMCGLSYHSVRKECNSSVYLSGQQNKSLFLPLQTPYFIFFFLFFLILLFTSVHQSANL